MKENMWQIKMSGTSKQGISLKRSQDSIQVQVDESSKCIKKRKVEKDTELDIPNIKGRLLKKVPNIQCGNYRICLSLRSFVKSILENFGIIKLSFLPF